MNRLNRSNWPLRIDLVLAFPDCLHEMGTDEKALEWIRTGEKSSLCHQAGRSIGGERGFHGESGVCKV